ncbi:hypothetical protein BH10PAT3_BH10PAT3_1090 [soil metagenome]
MPGQKTRAETQEPSILIGQVKITSSNGQFITLYNNSAAAIDMGAIRLVYFGSYDLKTNPSSKLISLAGTLAPHSYYLISDDSLLVCYKMTVYATSLGLSSTTGMVQVVKTTQASPGGLVVSELLDSFAWAKSGTVTPTPPTTLPRLPATTTDFLQRVWPSGLQKSIGGGAWQTVQPSSSDPCSLQTQLAASSTPSVPAVPAATTVLAAASVTEVANNVGLVAPEITELLPNPKAPMSDDTDEFIELYNPNDSIYDLSGYRVEAGTSYSRGYTFKDEILQPKSYTAFMITDTNLQLSNTEGQARLLLADGTVISETPGYESAPEGSAWGIISDSWQWLKTPTPNNKNVADSAADSGQKSASSLKIKKTTGKVAGTSTTTPYSNSENLNDAAPLHPLVLAGVGAAAVAYALYEYRRDMANRIFQFRRYLRNRRAVRARL